MSHRVLDEYLSVGTMWIRQPLAMSDQGSAYETSKVQTGDLRAVLLFVGSDHGDCCSARSG